MGSQRNQTYISQILLQDRGRINKPIHWTSKIFFSFLQFFFPNPPGLFIVFCSLHMFLKLVLNFFKHRKKLAGSCFITCLLILASYIYMGLFLADSCLWDLFKLFLNCAIFLGKLFVGVLWGLGRRYISRASRNRR